MRTFEQNIQHKRMIPDQIQTNWKGNNNNSSYQHSFLNNSTYSIGNQNQEDLLEKQIDYYPTQQPNHQNFIKLNQYQPSQVYHQQMRSQNYNQRNYLNRPINKHNHSHCARRRKITANHNNKIYMALNEQNTRLEQQRLIAKLFCQGGLNYSLCRYFYPSMTQQTYRSHLLTINNQAVNEVMNFLRYQCQIKTAKLNKDEKRFLRAQLIKVRQWLGNRDMSLLETYYKFIERHYEQKNIEIHYHQAAKLYKTFLQLIKGPSLAIQHNHHNKKLTIVTEAQPSKINFSLDEQIEIIKLYEKYKSLSKVTDILKQKFNRQAKWTRKAVRNETIHLIQICLKRLILCSQKYSSKMLNMGVIASKQIAQQLLDAQDYYNVKIQLLKFYSCKKISLKELTILISSINRFSYKSKDIDSDDCIEIGEIPKLQTSNKKQQEGKKENNQSQPINLDQPQNIQKLKQEQIKQSEIKEEVMNNNRKNKVKFEIDLIKQMECIDIL